MAATAGCAYNWWRLQLGAPTTGAGCSWVRLQLVAATAGCAYNWCRLQLSVPTTGGGYSLVRLQLGRLQLSVPTTGGGYSWVRLKLEAATAECAYNWWQLSQIKINPLFPHPAPCIRNSGSAVEFVPNP
jgi:hypothetical protein